METVRETRIWKRAFVDARVDANAQEQNYFRSSFEEMRERVAPIVGRILRDMPDYTVHDITHLDALWETASLVCPDELLPNPAEAFVLGGAILLHDAAMTVAAYPGGIAEI